MMWVFMYVHGFVERWEFVANTMRGVWVAECLLRRLRVQLYKRDVHVFVCCMISVYQFVSMYSSVCYKVALFHV